MLFVSTPTSGITFRTYYQVNAARFYPIADAGGIAGDFMIAFFSTPNAYTTYLTSGWTEVTSYLTSSGGQYLTFHVVARVLDGTESLQVQGFNNTGGTQNSTALIFTGINTFSSGSIVTSATSGNPGSQSITASSGTPPLIVFGSGYTGPSSCTAVDPFTFSTTATATYTSSQTNLKTLVAYKIYNSSPANTTVDMDDEGPNNILNGFYIQKVT